MSSFTDSWLGGRAAPGPVATAGVGHQQQPDLRGVGPVRTEVGHEHVRRVEAWHVGADERVIAEVGEVALAQRSDGHAFDRVGQVAGEVVVERADGHVHRIEEVVGVHADLLAADGHDRVAVVGAAVGEEERLRFGVLIVQVQRPDQFARVGDAVERPR